MKKIRGSLPKIHTNPQWKFKVITSFFVYVTIASIVIFLLYISLIYMNSLRARTTYEIHGLEVSHHQGRLNWQKISRTPGYSFVYIKATEGNDFTDDTFSHNWDQAQSNGFKVGAYHFFSMRSSGADQAKHFISIVPRDPEALAPAIDIEIHDKHNVNAVRQELESLSNILEAEYGKKPILYVTYKTYDQYIDGHFAENPIWIRDIFGKPRLNREWTMWQYSNQGRVSGIDDWYVDKSVMKTAKISK